MQKNLKKSKILFFIMICFIAVFTGAITIYVNDDYDANELAQSALQSDETVTVEYVKGAIVFMPAEAGSALIFYPGGKVDYEAYAPLMHAYAKEGMACILVEMPLQLAVFDRNAADDYRYLYPEIENWYLGGHSLGGAMASSYLEKHVDEYKGLILCASYSTADFSGTELTVVSMYGSNDEVLNREKYEESRPNLPADFAELVIEGGNHAFFGSYGLQNGDGIATITNEEQIVTAVEYTMDYIK